MQEDPLSKDSEVDDVGAINEFLAWWQVETKGDTREEGDCQVRQQVDKPSAVVKIREAGDDEPTKPQFEE